MGTGRKACKSRWGLLPIYMAAFSCNGLAGGATTLAQFSARPMGRWMVLSGKERPISQVGRVGTEEGGTEGLASREGKFLSNSGRGEVCWWKADFNVCWIKGGPVPNRATRVLQLERKNEENGSSLLVCAGPICRRRHTKGPPIH